MPRTVRLILDSHILIATALERLDTVLPDFARVSARPEMDLAASVVSLWEIAIKSRLGKLDAGMPVEVLPDFFMASGIAILPITAPHAVTRIDPLPPTRDPFDRLLLAQCLIEGRRLHDRRSLARPSSRSRLRQAVAASIGTAVVGSIRSCAYGRKSEKPPRIISERLTIARTVFATSASRSSAYR